MVGRLMIRRYIWMRGIKIVRKQGIPRLQPLLSVFLGALSRASLRFESAQENIDSFRGLIKKLSLFSTEVKP